jgi:putative intracellular protease/amidase
VRVLDAIFAERTLAEWRAQLADAEGVWAPMQSARELPDDPQAIANGYLPRSTAATGRASRSSRARCSSTANPPLRPAPDLGTAHRGGAAGPRALLGRPRGGEGGGSDLMTERTVGVVLFPGFELLDVFGPLEAFGNLPGMFRVRARRGAGGPGRERAGAARGRRPRIRRLPHTRLVLVPAASATRDEAENPTLLGWLAAAPRSRGRHVGLHGAALLARGPASSTPPRAPRTRLFSGSPDQGPKVAWVREARWVEDASSPRRPASPPHRHGPRRHRPLSAAR